MNKKGFTLAELLGVIVILILLVLIVTPIAINYAKSASDSVYDVQVKTIKASAKEWASDKNNYKLLPTEDGECIEVSLEKLKEAGYLDYNIKNPKTNEKFDDDLTVIIKKEGKNLTYTFNEDGTQVCSTIITTDYPKWVFISSNPTLASSTTEVTVNIESDKKISEYNLTADNIIVKVGSTINDNANILINCNNGQKLSCTLKLNNLVGDGRLTLVIDKNVMKDEDLNPSRKTNLLTDTIVDSKGPEITYTGRTNTNASIYYATKDDTVEIKFKAEDNQNITNNLTSNDIKVYLDGIEADCTKELTVTGSGKSLSYVLKLTNVTGSGKVSIKVPAGKVLDSLGNTNKEKIITPGITYDNIKPIITFEPNGETRYLQSITPTINVTDNETGVDESTIKYVISTNSNAEPTTSISNGGEITIKDVTDNYYIVGYACDYAGNCNTSASDIYHMNNSGPSIEISPTGNSGYAKTANIKIIVTAAGTALDEGSFIYTISTNRNATPDTSFVNNTNLNLPALTGVYYVNAKACDMEGNCSEAVSNKFYFDNSAPEIKYTPNGTSNTWKKNQSVAISVIDNIELDWSKYIITTDKTATPNVTITNGSANPNITGLTGIYYIVTKGCDKLSNCSMSNSDKFYFDNTGPTVSFGTNGNSTAAKSQASKVTLADANEGTVKNIKYTWSTSNSASASSGTTFTNATSISKNGLNGTYYLCIYGEDGLGNSTNKCSNAFKFDNTGPTVSFGTNGNSTYKKSQSSTITVTNDSYGASLNTGSYKYVWSTSTSGTPSTAYSSGGTATKSDGTGTFYLIATACDSLGNCTTKNTGAFYLDNTNPTVSVSVAGPAATITLKDVHSGLAGYKVTTSTSTPSSWDSVSGTNTNVSKVYTASTPGTYYAHVKDAAGNTAYASFTIANFTYNITYYLNGGTNHSSNPTTYSYGNSAITLQNPSREGFTFTGWTGNGTITPTIGLQIPANSTGDKSYTANWQENCSFAINSTASYSTVGIHPWQVPSGCTGTYQFEVYGAEGGSSAGNSYHFSPGKGGYSKGSVYLTAGTTVYVVVGGQGTTSTGGYNGGGNSVGEGGGGGGATHIGKSNAILKDTSPSNVYIVAGGGGGAGASHVSDTWIHNGGAGGGATGGDAYKSISADSVCTTGGTQSSAGYSFVPNNAFSGGFGYGGANTESWHGGGGGGGYYGGGAGENYNGGCGGGGGSGYIGGVTGGTMSSGVRSGNGYARITRIS